MRVEKVNVKEFLEALETVGNAIPTKTTIPCLTNINLKFEKDKITLLGFDTTTGIKKIMFNDNQNFNVLESGNVLVDYKMLKSILSKLNCPTIVFYTKDNQFIIENEKSVYRLNMTDINEYPKIEFKKLSNEIRLKTSELKNIINNTVFATATNEIKPVLTGVNFIGSDKVLKCVATDSFRLSQYTVCLENEIADINFVFPKQSLLALDKIINKSNEEYIKLLYDNNGKDILININNTLYKTRLLDGNYPNTSKLIAYYNCDKVCKINRNTLMETIDRISVFANDNQTIKLVFSNNQVEIKSTNNDVGNGNEIIYCESNFDLTIACNSKNINEALKVYNSEYVNIYLTEEIRPIYIKNENSDYLINVILPIRM